MIDRFYVNGRHNPASNFYPSPFRAPYYWPSDADPTLFTTDGDDLRRFDTVEHYYQAAKAGRDWAAAEKIRTAPSAGDAKRRGRQCILVPNWEAEKYNVMRQALAYKFAPGTKMAEWLIGTGTERLIEGNTWGDRVWGVDGTGQNWLGWLLMAQRAWLQST